MSDQPLNPEGQPPRSPRWHESIERFLSKNFNKLGGLALIGAAGIMYFDVAIPTEPPRWAHVVFWVAVLGLAPAYAMATKVVDILYDPFGVILLDIDARNTDVAIYNVPKKRWKEITVLEGDLQRLEATQLVYTGKNFDPEELTVTGTWRGSLSDYELVRKEAKIAELRGRLETEAKRGFAIETQSWTIVRQAAMQAVTSIVRTFERGTLPSEDGLEVADAVDDAIESFDFDLSEQEKSTDEGKEDVEDIVDNEIGAAVSEVTGDD